MNGPAVHDRVAQVASVGRVVAVRTDLPDARPLILEGTAVHVWRELDGTRDVTEIAETLAARFGAPVEVVYADVSRLLNNLDSAGLLGRAGAPSCEVSGRGE